jgi:hypothetical protein
MVLLCLGGDTVIVLPLTGEGLLSSSEGIGIGVLATRGVAARSALGVAARVVVWATAGSGLGVAALLSSLNRLIGATCCTLEVLVAPGAAVDGVPEMPSRKSSSCFTFSASNSRPMMVTEELVCGVSWGLGIPNSVSRLGPVSVFRRCVSSSTFMVSGFSSLRPDIFYLANGLVFVSF